jgi:hypothetical protein
MNMTPPAKITTNVISVIPEQVERRTAHQSSFCPRVTVVGHRCVELRYTRCSNIRGGSIPGEGSRSCRGTIRARDAADLGWRRDELMGAVLDELVEAGLPAPILPVPEKLRWVLERILVVLEHGIGRGGTAAVLAGRDPAFTTALRERLAEQLGMLRQAMAIDVEAGLLSPRVDPDTLVGLLFGAYLSEVLRYGAPRPGWVERTVELLAPAVTAA